MPVRGSTWLSEFATLPGVRKDGVVGQDQLQRRAFLRRPPFFPMKARYCASLTLNRTQIGSSGTMVVSGCAAFGLTRPPTGTSVSPIRPLMGAVMVPYCTLSVAVSSAPRCACTLPSRGLDLGFGGEPRLLDVGLVGADARLGGAQRGDRGVQILLGGGVLLHQRLQALVILLRLHQVGLRGGQVGLRLQQRNLALREIRSASVCFSVPCACCTCAWNGRRSRM